MTIHNYIIGRAVERTYGLESCASNRTRTLWQDRKHAFDSDFHLISRRVVEWCQRNRIDVFVLGYSEGWKTAVNLGRTTNRRFVQIPFARLAEMLAYKLAHTGIAFLKHEESYTSKCSFLDKEPVCKQVSYAGKRVHRGLFRASTGKLIHADVQGSLNVGRKVAVEYPALPLFSGVHF